LFRFELEKEETILKKIILFGVGIILVLSLCACSFSVSTANFKNLIMASEINEETFEPISATKSFTPTTPIIFLTGTIKNAPDGTVVKAEWLYVEDDSAVEIDSWEKEFENSTSDFQCNLSIPDNGWPTGKYEIKMYINDKYETTVDFRVVDEKME
jgi:hypothetical protein